MPHDAIKARLEVGKRLKKARTRINWSQNRAAAALGCTQSKINKMENEQVAISPGDLSQLLHLYSVPDIEADRIQLLAAQARGGPVAGVTANRDYLKLLEAEREAVEILGCYTERFPNLFQSEPYIAEQYKLGGALHDITSVLDSRREREELFQIDRPPQYRAVFSPSSFYRLPGGRKAGLGREQIEHVLRMMKDYRGYLYVHLLPWEAEVAYAPHDLTILKFEGQGKDMVYHEYSGGLARIYTGRQQVKAHIDEWDKVFLQALGVEATREALLKMHHEARNW
ncbi:Helix-turn-helix domain-containing protein [Amycolatopsis rubida]|uniref:Helix-turn-helix domain-containing protein n=1 Tax=Amycolatopsis rubida TaxID=112413 RepID=A0A1I5E4E3_9PSEU|nr:Helix-turn-helix domain-containing protein [Amycolatopsis rubida]